MMKFNFNKQILIYYYYKVYWIIILFFRKKQRAPINKSFTIGITTFYERYDVLFKDLIKRMVYLFPETEIIVAVNGHYDQYKQEKYLPRITEFCKKFEHIKLLRFEKPQGLSKLWNRIIINSDSKKIFIFNDDILFYSSLLHDIQLCGILNEQISILNDSFSHFMIDRNVVEKIGWFDERFTEIGGEDDDYYVRLLFNNIELKRLYVRKIRSYKPSLKINSYGRKTVEQTFGYSNANTDFLLRKWDIRAEYFNGAKYIVKSQGNYWKLRTGMETPDFY